MAFRKLTEHIFTGSPFGALHLAVSCRCVSLLNHSTVILSICVYTLDYITVHYITVHYIIHYMTLHDMYQHGSKSKYIIVYSRYVPVFLILYLLSLDHTFVSQYPVNEVIILRFDNHVDRTMILLYI